MVRNSQTEFARKFVATTDERLGRHARRHPMRVRLDSHREPNQPAARAIPTPRLLRESCKGVGEIKWMARVGGGPAPQLLSEYLADAQLTLRLDGRRNVLRQRRRHRVIERTGRSRRQHLRRSAAPSI